MSSSGLAQSIQSAQDHVVQFHARSFDLSEFRSAVRRRVSNAQLRAIVRGLEAAVLRDQAGFTERLRGLGGQVRDQWWLVNGCSIQVRPKHVAELRRWPNVRSVRPDTVRRPHLVDASDSLHHGSAAANRMTDSSGALVTGKGIAVAVLDTGADVDSGTRNRPHSCYFPGGDPSRTNNPGIGGSLLLKALKLPVSASSDDGNGHGTAVAGCVGANKWNSQADVGNGVAPGAGIVSLNITDKSGWSQDSWIVTAWQTIAALRLAHNIGGGNNSFSGSPNLDNIVQQALDSAALNADMLICVSAGNSGNYTAESQGAFNGLAVGSIDKVTKARSRFSAIGPLYGTNRTYPDITAVGNQLILPKMDDEGSKELLGGTSYAAPMVAGAAALVRQAAPHLHANAVRALLLHSVEFRTSDRNSYGLGSLRADAAVQAALNGSAAPGEVRTNRKVARYSLRYSASGPQRVTISWMRANFSSVTTPNLDLRILDDKNQVVAQDGNIANSYESIAFSATAHTAYTAEVTWVNPPVVISSVPFSIVSEQPSTAPSVYRVHPTTITAYQPAEITIEGRGLASTTRIWFGATSVTSFTVLDDSQIRVAPPQLMAIGPVTLRVETPYGLSDTRTLTVTGPGDPIFVGPEVVTRGATSLRQFHVYSGKGWRSLVLVSDNNQPSSLPGLYNLGIGNQWQSPIFSVTFLNHDSRGSGAFILPFPVSLPSVTVYLQAVSVNPAAVRTPFPSSNVHPLSIR